MWWPSPSDYQDTVQNPRVAFSDPELRDGTLLTDALGLPKPISGSFATIYQVDFQGHRHAVRCFLRHVPDIAQRYSAISSYLQQVQLPYMVEFRFIPQGIRVRGEWFPILKMDWLEGSQLDVYVAKHLNDPQALLEITRQFLQLAYALRQANIAHGDLQHGNLLVVKDHLRLLDYDGMFVPTLAGRPSNELGQPNYQHPIRSARDYGAYLDNFSVWVITLSLLGLALEPSLRAGFAGGGERLLLDQSDFVSPYHSKTLNALQQANNPTLRFLTLTFIPYLFARDLGAVPPLDPTALATLRAPAPAPASFPDWLSDQIAKPSPPPAPSTPTPAPSNGADWLLDHLEAPAPHRLTGSFRLEKSLLILVALVFSLLVGIILLGPIPPLVGFSILALLPMAVVLALSFGFSLRFNSPDRRDAVRSVREIEQERILLAAQVQELTYAREHLDREQQDAMGKLVKEQSANAAQEKTALAAVDQALQSELTKINARRQELDHKEAGVVESALKKLHAERMEKMLEAFRVSDAMLPGIINRELKQTLARHGFVTAADIASFRVNPLGGSRNFQLVNRQGVSVYVEGLSADKGVALILWRRAMEARVRKLLPATLPADMAAQLGKKYKDERVNLQLAELKRKQESQESKTRLAKSAGNENERLTRAMKELPATYLRKMQVTEQELASARKALAEKEWALMIARRRLQTFAHINFFNYLKSILGL